MLKEFPKILFTAKAAIDILKEKIESKVAEALIQVKNYRDGNGEDLKRDDSKDGFKEKVKEQLTAILTEINHKSQMNEVQLRGFVKDKLIELTNNALLDSQELNDLRAEIATLHAEIADIKAKIKSTN